MSCRNICIELKAKKSFRTSYYEDGLRRCTECEIFMRWNGMRSSEIEMRAINMTKFGVVD